MLSVRKARQPLPLRRDRKTRRVHDHGEIGVVPVDAGDIQDTDFAKTLERSVVRRIRDALIGCNSIVKS